MIVLVTGASAEFGVAIARRLWVCAAAIPNKTAAGFGLASRIATATALAALTAQFLAPLDLLATLRRDLHHVRAKTARQEAEA